MGDEDAYGRLVALQRDPYPAYARARDEPGLDYSEELGGRLVTRQADVREVLRRPEDFSSANALTPDVMPAPEALAELGKGPGGGPVVVTADGAEHLRLRAPLTRGLSASRVAAAVPFITARAEALVDAFAGADRAELMRQYAKRLPGETVGHLLGLDPADVPAAVHGSYRAEELLFRPLPVQEQILAARDMVALQWLLLEYAQERHRKPGTDLCTEIVQAIAPDAGEEGLTPQQRGEVVSNLQNLLIAGHLTTTALIATTLYHLLRNRSQWDLLCADPALIPAAIEEAARYDTAVQGFRRVTTRPVTLAGVELPTGEVLFVAYGAANRDPAAVDRPEVFDITREPVRHLAFGHGVHSCPGSQLAREQLRITLETFTRRLPGLRLDPDGGPVEMLPTMIHRSPRALPVTW
jgi:cytochrome P450